MTAEYARRSGRTGRVLVDYNQNAWGSTLASVYSVRPPPEATRVDADDLGGDAERRDRQDFTMRQRARSGCATLGDLWKPMLAERGRARLPTSP